MKKISVAIILVNWNSCKDTLACLQSLRLLHSDNLLVKTIVVDNASTDDSLMQIQKKYPYAKIISLTENKGFTGGNNEGILYALKEKADYIWLLNNDTIVDSNALTHLLAAFDDPSVGLAGSKIYFMKGFEYHKKRYMPKELGHVLWYAGGLIDWDNIYGSHRGVDQVDVGQYDQEEETDFATGCSLMISRECIQTIGLLDNNYFAYLEDMDYSIRAKLAGYKVLYIPSSKIWHKNAGSTGGAGNILHEYYMTRNRLYFGMRYAKFRTKLALLKEAGRFIHSGTKTQRKAVLDALLGKRGKR